VAVALIVAAGRGERLGAPGPKAFVALAGRPLVAWSLETLAGVTAVERIVVAVPPELARGAAGATELAGVALPRGTVLVEGGATRSHSVRNALAAAGPGDPVLVHDAARPLATHDLFERALAELEHADAAVAAARVTDTIKEADPGGTVRRTLDRSALWAIQTPQAFRREALVEALAQPDDVLAAATDDAWLVERAGGTVRVVESPPNNLKVTTRLDLRVAELLLAERC
jgi:2-C-methyl-D-erythritol 4-phosphate cytidylyltransferase